MDELPSDEFWMRRALAEAARGEGFVEPNPVVGAAVVRDGRLVATGYHARFGGPHAEVDALQRAGEAARGATLYVTLEPCCHHGKTPPCTDAVLRSGIARVVAAMRDPFPKVAGGGIRLLADAGLSVTVGVEEAEAVRLNAPYLKRLATGSPYVIAKWAMTLDGRIATASGDSQWISGPRSRGLVHERRGKVDAVAVGIGTALADNPRLTARPPGPRVPARLVLDSLGRLPLDSHLVRSAREVPVWVAVTERAPVANREALSSRGCEVIVVEAEGRGVSVNALLRTLGDRGVTNLLVEGGSRVLGAMFDAGQVDEVDVFLAPVIEGGGLSPGPVHGTGVPTMNEASRIVWTEVARIDGDLRLRGRCPTGPWSPTPLDSA